ncbi:SAM domain-containing protein SAMSN-1 isoform X1 [Hyaena hyaena]|uniref:SAM domain-containing protein SAMSN-1 isoform X1 n=1 Tax=Hyaena hyaena TaxID=95912 RepID=UPI00192250E8|nr:SAM domain-containing protein SAMSN-1 isoform X1 [Hyaena hyaena]
MNLFCFSLEGSMDSLYEPAPEQQANQGSTSVGTGSLISPFGESGKAHNNLFMEVSDFENAKPKRKSIQRSMSESQGFERKMVNDTIWQEPSKPENDSHIRRLCQLKEDEDETLISCMKLTKSQEKKISTVSPRGKKEMERRLDTISASLVRSSTSTGCNMAEMLSHNEGEVQLWNSWKPFPKNPLRTCVDFQIAQVGPWNDCSRCTHHPQLKSSCTDMDLTHSWRSSSFGNFDRFRNNSISKPDDSAEVYEGEPINENGEQNKTSHNGGGLGKRMRAISWTMKKKVGKKYIKALSEEKDEEDGEDTLPYRNSDPMIGCHTEKISLKASDSMDSLYSGRSSSSGVTSCSDGTSNRDSFRLDDDGPYSGPFCGRARVHTDFTPSPYDTDSLKIKKGDIIDIICKTPMGMWTGMLNNKVGNFKFIYVDVISEEEAAPKKIKAHRRSGKEKPKTLQEFLQRIHLQEYTSTLLLNGYETLEDLKDIQESHLIELNIKNPEDRMRLLSAAENLLDEETIQEQENESEPLSLSPGISLNKSQADDCPRDSGCYISSENSDNGKEDLESENLSDMVQKISITEPSD